MSASLAKRPLILNEFVVDVAGTLDPCSARELGVREDAYLQVVRPAAGSGGLLRIVLMSSDTTRVAMRHQLTWTTDDPDRWAIALDDVREDPDAVILHLATVWRKNDGGQSE